MPTYVDFRRPDPGRSNGRPAQALPADLAPHRPWGMGDALRAVEALLLGGGQQTARRNAWNAVCEDRRRARDRREAMSVLDTAARDGLHTKPN